MLGPVGGVQTALMGAVSDGGALHGRPERAILAPGAVSHVQSRRRARAILAAGPFAVDSTALRADTVARWRASLAAAPRAGTQGLARLCAPRRLATVGVALLLAVCAVALAASPAGAASLASAFTGVGPQPAAASTTTTYTATETIPVPPASAYAGSGGGDGWAVALSSNKVYNVFHHSGQLQVACHLQSDASACWAPETITDSSGDNFATSGQPGLWLNQATGHLYVYASRTSDSTGGVVCVDTTSAATNPDPFCGFIPLTAIGDAPTFDGISFISDPMIVGTRWYAFNYVNGVSTTGTKNTLLCFDLTTLTGCASQPYTVAVGAGTVADGSFPPPETAAIGSRLIIPVTVGFTDELACFDAATLTNCAGAWPVPLGVGYDSSFGAPFPMMTATGSIDGLCLPTGADPCYSLNGAAATTPAGMAGVITATSGWNGPAFVLGPRVYVPDGNSAQVDCFDYSTGASCTNFPKPLANLGLLYTVNPDPQRPTCIWVNSDDGADQIQNFDAYTGGACGQGPIRVLASSLVVPTQLCIPTAYTSLQVLSPSPSSYTSGEVSFEDGDGNPIAGTPIETLDATGTGSLTGLNLNTAQGLPQFLITLNGASSTPTSVEVQLTWTGVSDPSCVPAGSVKPSLTVTPVSRGVVRVAGAHFAANEQVDVLLNTEAGAILLAQMHSGSDGAIPARSVFVGEPMHHLKKGLTTSGLGFSVPNSDRGTVNVPLRDEQYQLDFIGESVGDGGSLKLKFSGGNLNETQPIDTTSGSSCAAADLVRDTPLSYPGYLSTSGRWIVAPKLAVVGHQHRVKLASVNWYGAEEADFVAGGLNCQSAETIAEIIREEGFNSVRLPWSNAMLEENPPPCSSATFRKPCIDPWFVHADPTLAGKNALEIYKAVIAALAHDGVMTVLDDHTTDAEFCCIAGREEKYPGFNGLWWGGQLWDDAFQATPSKGNPDHWRQRQGLFQTDWHNVVTLVGSEPDVIGADLRNEPDGAYGMEALWEGEGTNRSSPENWEEAARQAAAAVLAVNPELLIMVEGTRSGANLEKVPGDPLELSVNGTPVSNKLVYSPHAYSFDHFGGKGARYAQFTSELGKLWGVILVQHKPWTAPIWIGEFGGTASQASVITPVSGTTPCDTGDRAFLNCFLNYIEGNDADWAWWGLNGTISDSGALVDNTGALRQQRAWFEAESYGILNTGWAASNSPLINDLNKVELATQFPP